MGMGEVLWVEISTQLRVAGQSKNILPGDYLRTNNFWQTFVGCGVAVVVCGAVLAVFWWILILRCVAAKEICLTIELRGRSDN